MTEEQAKTRWCPQVTVIAALDGDTFINNRGEHDMSGDSSIAKSANCIASDCMMWVVDIKAGKSGAGTSWPDKGHCGLIK